MSDTTQTDVNATSTMEQILETYPGAQRTLFREYHIGGCSSCGFKPEETLEEVCSRNEIKDVSKVLDVIHQSHEQDRLILIPPQEVKTILDSGLTVKLLDIRSREEFEAVQIEGSVLMSQDVMQDIMAHWNPDDMLVVIDHKGAQGLDAAAYFLGHGMKNVRCLQGGIDAWSQEIDDQLPRYRLAS